MSLQVARHAQWPITNPTTTLPHLNHAPPHAHFSKIAVLCPSHVVCAGRTFPKISASVMEFNRRTLPFVSAFLLCAPAAFAQTNLPPAAPPSTLPAAPSEGDGESQVPSAPSLVSEALLIAQRNPEARVVVTRTAAALLPRLPASQLNSLSARWQSIARSSEVPQAVRSDAYAAFFDVAARTDPDFATSFARRTPDLAARAGGLLRVSRRFDQTDWRRADSLLGEAISDAKNEPQSLPRARALVFAAYRASELNPARQSETLQSATSNVNSIGSAPERDALLCELAGAAARFDVTNARSLASRIQDPALKNLAAARIGLVEISQTTLMASSANRVQALATAAAPYDSRALPTLLQLPAQPDVLKAIAQTLPPIYPTARPAIDESELETLWDYTSKASEGVYRDQLQSRIARLMVTKDLWRGRDYGKQLSWKGGRVQVGAFLKSVLEARQSQLGAAKLQDTAKGNIQTAYNQTKTLPPAARAEALLLLAGQVLG